MKKKYSTLLNFALATCVATALVACSEGDSTYSGGPISGNSAPSVNITGNVLDTNGNPLQNVTVSCGGEQAMTNSSGQWTIKNLSVINVVGGREGTQNSGDEWDQPLQCIVEAPSGYLGGQVWVYPEAQVINTLYDNTSEENSQTNQPLIWFDGMYAQAATAWLPKLDSEVCGVLRFCDTGEPVTGAQLKLDMWAVSNNSVIEQAQNNHGETWHVGFSNSDIEYQTTTDAVDATFCIDGVPDDSILRLYATQYQDLYVAGNGSAEIDPNYGDCSGNTPCTAEGAYITTVNEGLLTLGNVCVDTIDNTDEIKPCVADIEGWIYPLGFQDGGTIDVDTPWFDDTLEFALLEDDITGQVGHEVKIVFNEALMSGAIDENSVVIWDVDEEEYITDFSVGFAGSTLTITTTDPIPADDHILVYLLRDDFRDLAGNYLYAADIFNAPSSCDDVFFVEEFYSNNDTAYVVVGFKIHSPDSTNVGEATDLAQVCLDEGGAAGLAALNADYPSVFTDQGSSTTKGLFQNLNSDTDYRFRLEALADVVGGTDSGLANVANGFATVTFTEPTAGSWEASSPGNSVSPSSGSANGSSDSVVVSGAAVGDTVYITSLDDFDNPSNVASITLVDCVAPTTVLNYAYNTCGHLGYDNGSWEINDHGGGGDGAGEGFDTDYAAHICVANDDLTVPEFGDGGENTAEETTGFLGIPTLNITCRLMKDPADAPNVVPPINIDNGLYSGVNIDQTGYYGTINGVQVEKLYDATEFAAWGPFADTIGVAFSENIAMTAGGTIDWAGVTDITSWSVGNNIGLTDDGDQPDGSPVDPGSYPVPTVDLAQITVDDLLTLANVDHGLVMDFSAAVEDLGGNAAENARVIVNDLLPPFVEWAYWNGGLVIQFNEAINPVMATDNVRVCDPIAVGCATIPLTNATLSMSDTRLTIPQVDVAAQGVNDTYFPTFDSNDTNTAGALTYAEPIYDALGLGFTGPYDHAILVTDEIPDAHGNTGFQNDGGNTWGQWNSGFGNIDDDSQCNTPEFAVVDVLGPFQTSTLGVTNFTNGDPALCVGGPPGTMVATVSHVMSYSFTHPINLEQSFPGAACANLATLPDDCTVSDINTTVLDATWVDTNILSQYGVAAAVTIGANLELEGVGAVINASATGMNITVRNGTGVTPFDCWNWNTGDRLIPDPTFNVFSIYGVGTGQALGAQSVTP